MGGRHTHPYKILRVRYKDVDKVVKARLVFVPASKKKVKLDGKRVLHVRKISLAELHNVADYDGLVNKLQQELVKSKKEVVDAKSRRATTVHTTLPATTLSESAALRSSAAAEAAGK
jgi:hypothetical protein